MALYLILFGLLLGPAINFAIYQFAYFTRPISPWQRSEQGKQRSVWCKLPIVGWLLRTSESKEFGPRYWLRPMLIEAAVPILLWLLYERVVSAGLIQTGAAPVASVTLHRMFLNVAVLFSLLIVATFIDFDERTIPDLVTVPGTCFALIGALVFPDWRMREIDPLSLAAVPWQSAALHAYSPFAWPMSLTQPGSWSLPLAFFLWFGWCFALLNRQWITRRGWNKAWRYFGAIILRDPSTRWISVLAFFGAVLIPVVYGGVDAVRWESFLSALMGLGLGGMLVWSFRLVAAGVMRKEALGFGDVTLMAMVGAFVGWQDVWVSFFLSPFFALIFVVGFWIVTRDPSTPFGPYLSMAVIYTIWNWADLWPVVSELMLPPEFLLLFWSFLLVALAAMLGVVEFVKMVFRRT